jgi:ankyrin repeat protein
MDIFQAIYNDNLNEVKSIVNQPGFDINKVDNYGYTALIEASDLDDLEIVKFLVEHGADVNKAGINGYTALLRSLYRLNLEIVKYLVEHGGADVNQADNDGNTALIEASGRGRLDIVKYFVEHGADLNQANKEGKTALTVADEIGFSNIVDYLKKYVSTKKIQQGFRKSRGYAAWKYSPEKMKAEGMFDEPDYSKGLNGFGKKRKNLKVSLRSLLADIKYLSK